MIKPPAMKLVGQVVSLLNILGAISRRKLIKQSENDFKPIAIPIQLDSPPVEAVKGIGKKLGSKLRSFGIFTVEDLKAYNLKRFKLPGITAKRIQKWQSTV